MDAQRRGIREDALHRLISANHSVVDGMLLDDVLWHVAEAALSLVDARHCAVGVFSADGAIERMIHVGAPPRDTVAGTALDVPIRAHGQPVGTLRLVDRVGGRFTAEDEELVTALADTAGLAIDNARLHDDLQRQQTPGSASSGAPAPQLPTELTLRERQALELITEGLTNREIGERLGIAEKTVKNYVSSLFAKLGMERRSQVAAFGATLRARAAARR